MKKVVLAVAILALVVGAASATAGRAAVVNCGKLKAGGKTWQIIAARVSCKKARSVVRTLAPKPARKLVRYSGKYYGMKCIGVVGRGRREIQCGGRRGQTLVASTKT